MTIETTTLAGGCFWCLEAVYDEIQGVTDVLSGYMGGKVVDPSYEAVCTGRTGHAEVVQIKFDTEQIAFRDLLDIFFTIHDPTTLNRQGADAGTQYRSAIYYHTDAQRDTALATIAELNAAKLWSHPIVTEVTAREIFYVAEDYHQNYFAKNPFQGYCQAVVAPKVAKARKHFTDRFMKKV